MKAVVFHRPKSMQVDEVRDPAVEHPRDAIVKVTSTASSTKRLRRAPPCAHDLLHAARDPAETREDQAKRAPLRD
jgi:hypothetical protein